MPRQRRGGGTPTASKTAPANWMHSGKEALDRVDTELKRAEAKRAQAGKGRVFDFFMKPGETKEYAILDEEPSCFIYEHVLRDPKTGNYSLKKTCPGDHDNCPACENVKESTYVMKLSILDFTPYKDSKGVTHEFSRKLMTVKPGMQKKFLRRFNKEGTLRGAVFEASRDGKKDFSIGGDLDFIEFMSPEELERDYIVKWTDAQGKEHEDNLSEPFNYNEIIDPPDVEELRALVGGAPTPGSSRYNAEALDDDGWEEDKKWEADSKDDDEPWDAEEEEEKPKTSRRRGARKEAAEEEAPAKTRASRRSKSEDSVEDESVEEEKPKRRSRRTRR